MMLSKRIYLINNFISYIISPFLSFFAITILSPFFLSIGLLILFLDGRPILFKSERVGYLGKTFILYKFRSMKNINLEDEKR